MGQLRKKLSEMADLKPERIVFVEVQGPVVSRVVALNETVRGHCVSAYEIKPALRRAPPPRSAPQRTSISDTATAVAGPKAGKNVRASESPTSQPRMPLAAKRLAHATSSESLLDDDTASIGGISDIVTPRASYSASPVPPLTVGDGGHGTVDVNGTMPMPGLSAEPVFADEVVAGALAPPMLLEQSPGAATGATSNQGDGGAHLRRPPRRLRFIRNHFNLIQRRLEQVREHLVVRTAYPLLFGTPRFLPYTPNKTTWAELYAGAWKQLSRFVDDTLQGAVATSGQYPFALTVVSSHEPTSCGICPWYHHCMGK